MSGAMQDDVGAARQTNMFRPIYIYLSAHPSQG